MSELKVDTLTPVLTKHWGEEGSWKLDHYVANGGYSGARKALEMEPGDVVEMVKNAGLRGRGGAGFPTGVKWSFLPKDNPNPSI